MQVVHICICDIHLCIGGLTVRIYTLPVLFLFVVCVLSSFVIEWDKHSKVNADLTECFGVFQEYTTWSES